MSLADLLTIFIAVLKALVILVAAMTGSGLLSWVERRMLAWWQDRYGPNRVGPFGILQFPADMIKLFFKEDWAPPFADTLTFWLAPVIGMSALLIALAIVPFTPEWGVANLDIAVLFFLGMAGLGIYAVLFAGWSSNSKYALLGSMRAAAQTLSYEVFIGLSLMGVVALTGSFNMRDIVAAQQHGWFVVPQFFGFCAFLIAGIALAHRAPFDFPESEQELAAGFHTEYSSMKWAMFFVGEYVGIILISSLTVALFFGGWYPPALLGVDLWPQFLSFIPPFIWFAIKTAFFIMIFILIRGALMRPRYDQVMAAGWKFFLPLTLVNLLVTAAVVLQQPALGGM